MFVFFVSKSTKTILCTVISDKMATVESNRVETCTPSSNKPLGNYKCSQCSEVFSKPGVLRRHFKSIHSGQHDPEGPLPCSEQGCHFSNTGRQEYQAHHGLSLIPCTFKACKYSFLTHEEMERHSQGHMPFGCFQCQFVTFNLKDLRDHLPEHFPPNAQGKHRHYKELVLCYKNEKCCPSFY